MGARTLQVDDYYVWVDTTRHPRVARRIADSRQRTHVRHLQPQSPDRQKIPDADQTGDGNQSASEGIVPGYSVRKSETGGA